MLSLALVFGGVFGKDCTFKAKARTKDLTLKAKARTKDSSLKPRTGPRTEILSLRTTKDQGQGQHHCSYVCCLSMLENNFSTFYPKLSDVHPRKSSQLQGGLCPPELKGALPPWPPDQGLCPWTPLGAMLPDPHYSLALRARHGLQPPKSKIPGYVAD